jgi:hypothetical protein
MIDQMAVELDRVADSHWYYCTFRNSYLLCLYGNEDVNNKRDMQWMSFMDQCPTIREFCETHIFPMTTILPRIIVIRTLPGMEMKHHTDCYPDEIAKLEPKLRMVLKGRKKNTLYFINEDGHHVHISDEWPSYIMSGAAIHGMKNQGEEKYTLCFGDPWVGDDLQNDAFVEFMAKQMETNASGAILISDLGTVDHLSGIKDPKKERIYSWDEWHARSSD